jgi:hypothetical protein
MYEHPFISVNTLSEDETLDGLQTKIIEISGKLNFAYRTNNQVLINQLNMVMHSYTLARDKKLTDMFPKDNDGGQSDKIDIS